MCHCHPSHSFYTDDIRDSEKASCTAASYGFCKCGAIIFGTSICSQILGINCILIMGCAIPTSSPIRPFIRQRPHDSYRVAAAVVVVHGPQQFAAGLPRCHACRCCRTPIVLFQPVHPCMCREHCTNYEIYYCGFETGQMSTAD